MISRRRFFAISLAVILFAMFGVEDRCFHKSSQLELSDGHSIHHLKGSLLHFILVVHRFTIAVKVFDLLLVVIQVDASLDVWSCGAFMSYQLNSVWTSASVLVTASSPASSDVEAVDGVHEVDLLHQCQSPIARGRQA